jgi:hexosaminidase
MSRLLVARMLLAATIVPSLFLQACFAMATPAVAEPNRRPATFRIEARAMVDRPAVVPLPRRMRRRPGKMVLGPAVVIRTSGSAARATALQLASELKRLGITATVDEPTTAPATIQLRQTERRPEIGAEGYDLEVAATGITIAANSGAGLFYGAETLEQLISSDGRKPHGIGFVRITDWPQYRWRGIHLDVSRHFFPVRIVEQYIDTAARFKLNTFHWHLTDDQGWRIDIPTYPRLVSIGGCRAGACAYYTANDVRAVVAFAAKRHVTIVPEIEGPGHSVEALAAYPFLACGSGRYATLSRWGSTGDSLCPTEQTFQFYDVVFRRLAQLFPGPIIHIGGDEVQYSAWRADPQVAALMRRERLGSYAAVQGYFTRRLEAIARKYHRRIAGWDEILNAAVSRTAIITAWRGEYSTAIASHDGYDVVATPNAPLYLDAYQGPPEYEPRAIGHRINTLRMVYDYDPARSIHTRAERNHLLGAQANMWTEYVATPSHLWYMAYPRVLALSELCWTPPKQKNWPDFKRRAGIALQRLESLNITFRIPEVTFAVANAKVVPIPTRPNIYHVHLSSRSSRATIVLESIIPNATIHYTLDRTIPTLASRTYNHPLDLAVSRTPKHIAAIAALIGHRASAPSVLTLEAP